MESKLFFKWINHFIKQTNPTPESPVVLLLDGHKSHTSNLEALRLAKESNVHVLYQHTQVTDCNH